MKLKDILGLFVLTATAWGQRFPIITTLAGSDFVFRGDGRPAVEAQISDINNVAIDLDGDPVVADFQNHIIFKVRRDGILQVLGGTGIPGFSGDGGPATRASLSFPNGIAIDRSGAIYFTDVVNRRVRRISPGGIIETVAGSGATGDEGDGGSALAASFLFPRGICFDAEGNLYIADGGANRIRKLSPNGLITAFAGTGRAGFSGDGRAAVQAQLFGPNGVAFDRDGNVFIADTRNGRIRKVDPRGIITTVAGGGTGNEGDGVLATDAFLFPIGVTVDREGNVLFSNVNNVHSRVYRFGSDGRLRVVAGQGRNSGGDGGPATSAGFAFPAGLAIAPDGTLYIADSGDQRLRRVSAGGIADTAAGSGQHRFSGDGGPAVAASFGLLVGVTSDRAGNIYVSERNNKRIRKIAPNGIITTFAGNGKTGSAGDGGPATEASFGSPAGLAADASNNIYVADSTIGKIRRISPAGIVTTVAGSGTIAAPPQDGARAVQASLAFPTGVALGPNGTLFAVDTVRCAVYRVEANGLIFRHAGRDGICGFAGDNGPAREALLDPGPTGLSGGIIVDSNGAVYIADGGNLRVRRVDPNGTITTVVGTGVEGLTLAPVPARTAQLQGPESLSLDAAGNLFIGDGPQIVLMAQGSAFRLAGNPGAELGDGGPALSAGFFGVPAIHTDRLGNVILADFLNRRLRMILARAPEMNANPSTLRFNTPAGGAPPPPLPLTVTAEVPGLAFTVRTSVPGSTQWLSVSAPAGVTPRVLNVSVDPAALLPGTYFGSILIESPNANPPSRTISVTVTVTPGQPPRLAVDRENLSFTTPRSVPARSQKVRIENLGGGRLEFRATVSTNRGGAWLRVSPAAGTLVAGQPQNLEVTADPTGLLPGTYTGRVTIAGGDVTRVLPVSLLISRNDRAILLSQTGLSFTGVVAGGVLPPRSFEVINAGRGRVDWNVSIQTLDGGPGWLRVNRTEGSSEEPPAAAPRVEVQANTDGLAAGAYYALVTVEAPGAANTPQVVTVFLEVLARGADPGAVVEPAELVFTTVAGRSPSVQEVLVYNIAERPKTFRSTAGFQLTAPVAGARIANLPSDAQLAVNEPNRVLIQPFVGALPPGVHAGTVNLEFTDGRVVPVRVRVIVTGFAGRGAGKQGRYADGCDASQLVPAVLSLSPSAQVTPGWPVPLTAEVRDNCGDPLDAGAVEVSFSNDPSIVALQRIGGGRWTGTWVPRTSTDQVVLKFNAADATQRLRGEQVVNIGTRPRQDPPLVNPSSVVSAASPSPFTPLAPGALISIFGERLAEVTQAIESGPLPRQVGATRVFMGGIQMPISFASPTQINAVVPMGLNPDTIHQVYVRRGNTASRPVNLDVASAQPAVFLAGGGEPRQGQIFVTRPGADAALANAANPARAGDRIRILAAGLGLTAPAAEDGQPSPEGAAVVEAVSVAIGGIEAQEVTAELLPGTVGVYRIEATMPAGVGRGNAQPVVVTAAGQASPVATMAVE